MKPNANARKTHCLRGHLLRGDNVYRTKRGTRQCIACQRGRRKDSAEMRRSVRQDRPELDSKAIARLRDAVADGVPLYDLAGRFGIGKNEVAAYLEVGP